MALEKLLSKCRLRSVEVKSRTGSRQMDREPFEQSLPALEKHTGVPCGSNLLFYVYRVGPFLFLEVIYLQVLISSVVLSSTSTWPPAFVFHSKQSQMLLEKKMELSRTRGSPKASISQSTLRQSMVFSQQLRVGSISLLILHPRLKLRDRHKNMVGGGGNQAPCLTSSEQHPQPQSPNSQKQTVPFSQQ